MACFVSIVAYNCTELNCSDIDFHLPLTLTHSKAKNHLKACTHLQITTEGQKEALPKPIPIMATHLLNEAEMPLLIAHGSVLKLRFERVVSL